MERFTAAFPILLVAILAGMSYWLERAVQGPPPPRDGSTRHDPDSIVDNFVVTQLGKDGIAVHHLEARRMLHYPDDNTTHLEHPLLQRYDAGRLALRISATRALASDQGKTVDFFDDVKAVRMATGKYSELTMTTEYLHVVPDDDFAKTDKPVRIVDANTQVTAVGLDLDNRAKTLKLLSNVRGSYVQRPH